MEEKKINSRHLSIEQKKKLVELVRQNPDIENNKIAPSYSNYKTTRSIWEFITSECNSLPGTRKTWRQWRKTWQDLKSKSKREQKDPFEVRERSVPATDSELAALVNDTVNGAFAHMEFVQLDNNTNDDDNGNLETDYTESQSEPEPESPSEDKVFVQVKTIPQINNTDSNTNNSPHDRERLSTNNVIHKNCEFDCNMLALHEERKIRIKDDYFKFKKDYLRQKIELLKEQTEAMKNIAEALSKK